MTDMDSDYHDVAETDSRGFYNARLSKDHPSAFNSDGEDLMGKDQGRYGDFDSSVKDFGQNQAQAYARRSTPSSASKNPVPKDGSHFEKWTR